MLSHPARSDTSPIAAWVYLNTEYDHEYEDEYETRVQSNGGYYLFICTLIIACVLYQYHFLCN